MSAKNNTQAKLQEEVQAFVENIDAIRFSKNLRRLLMEYFQTDSAKESMWIDDFLIDAEKLFVLLDAIEENGFQSK